ncbi:MAG: condensation domain-containing protein, partial [Acidobacteriota bacterium]
MSDAGLLIRQGRAVPTSSVTDAIPVGSSQRSPLSPRADNGPAPPLSHAQRSLWFMDRLVPNHSFYNVPSALSLVGELVPASLQRAFDKLVERHEALRTVFPETDGRPTQKILAPHRAAFEAHGVSGESLDERRARARGLAAEACALPFDLQRGPLMKVSLFEIAPDEHLLAINLHHIIADGWSLGVLAAEISELYSAALRGRAHALPPLSLQPADHAVWQERWIEDGGLDRGIEFFRRRLADTPPAALP